VSPSGPAGSKSNVTSSPVSSFVSRSAASWGQFVAVDMTSWWEPHVEFLVVVEQGRPVVDDVDGGDEMACRLHTIPIRALGFGVMILPDCCGEW